MKFNQGEELFLIQLKEFGLPKPKREYRFHATRKWRFDFAWPEKKIAVEIEGGVWNYGRHNRAKGFIQDCEKYNEAILLGWKVLRCPTSYITEELRAVNMAMRLFRQEND